MTDFVDRLLGRSAVAPIRPLLPTLFEPVRRDHGDELPMGVSTLLPGDAAGIADRSAVGAEHSPQQLVQSPAPAPPPATVPAQDPAAELGSAQPPVEHRETVHTATVRELHTVSPKSEAPRPGASRVLDAHEHREPAVPVTPTVQPSKEVAPQFISPKRCPDVPARVGPTDAPAPDTATRPRRSRRDPDVYVTIGRVEIKAQTKPAALPARADQRSRAPRLTLEDYLKSRES